MFIFQEIIAIIVSFIYLSWDRVRHVENLITRTFRNNSNATYVEKYLLSTRLKSF